jgi:hypothetical protein
MTKLTLQLDLLLWRGFGRHGFGGSEGVDRNTKEESEENTLDGGIGL